MKLNGRIVQELSHVLCNLQDNRTILSSFDPNLDFPTEVVSMSASQRVEMARTLVQRLDHDGLSAAYDRAITRCSAYNDYCEMGCVTYLKLLLERVRKQPKYHRVNRVQYG